jgi:hypothetical protein
MSTMSYVDIEREQVAHLRERAFGKRDDIGAREQREQVARSAATVLRTTSSKCGPTGSRT